MITIQKCSCGKCHDYWLVGIGKFVQGSGFTETEAQWIADLINRDTNNDQTPPSAESTTGA